MITLPATIDWTNGLGPVRIHKSNTQETAMTKAEALKELKAAGTAQNRKVYARHGVAGPMYGVSYAALGKLKKRIKIDQPLAEKLWATGIQDAMALGRMIADPAQMTATKLNAWVKTVGNRGLAAELSNLAAESPVARKQTDKWVTSKNELIGCAGWHTLASIARQESGLPDAYFEDHLETIESKIHTSKNWVKYAMNNALISIGTRNTKLEKKAIAAAKRIGKVEVDHGETGCKNA